MEDIKKTSSYRVLFLLNMLYDKECSKNEIIEKFKKNNIKINKTTVSNYINKLKNSGIPVVIKQIKNINYYTIDKNTPPSLNFIELSALSAAKNLLISSKNLEIIKKAIRIFYKFALHIKDNDTKYELLNFNYYSKINWSLVKKLNEHCKNKDIIAIDYITSNEKIKTLIIHADMIKIGDMSDRLYLSCILNGDNKLSQLPVDKIFAIKKVVKKCVKMGLKMRVLTYKISKKALQETSLGTKEKLVEIKNDIATIQCPLYDTFFTLQRLMSFCPELYYISDETLRNLVKEKLSNLKSIYNE